MRGIGRLRQVAARDLVLAPAPPASTIRKPRWIAKSIAVIVADLEMQERVMLDRAPVAAEQRIRADEIDRARDPAVVALRHHQEHVLAHGFADQRKEFSREIRPAPFARTGLM